MYLQVWSIRQRKEKLIRQSNYIPDDLSHGRASPTCLCSVRSIRSYYVQKIHHQIILHADIFCCTGRKKKRFDNFLKRILISECATGHGRCRWWGELAFICTMILTPTLTPLNHSSPCLGLLCEFYGLCLVGSFYDILWTVHHLQIQHFCNEKKIHYVLVVFHEDMTFHSH